MQLKPTILPSGRSISPPSRIWSVGGPWVIEMFLFAFSLLYAWIYFCRRFLFSLHLTLISTSIHSPSKDSTHHSIYQITTFFLHESNPFRTGLSNQHGQSCNWYACRQRSRHCGCHRGYGRGGHSATRSHVTVQEGLAISTEESPSGSKAALVLQERTIDLMDDPARKSVENIQIDATSTSRLEPSNNQGGKRTRIMKKCYYPQGLRSCRILLRGR